MIKCALYLRVSSDKQVREGESIPAQLDALRKYASDHGMKIVGEYIDDGISGTKYSERDELQRMLSDVEAGKIDLILITKLDRFFRSIRWYVNTQAVLDAHGVNWIAIWEPIYDTTTPQGRLIVNQMMSIAQFEAENTGQRIKQVQAYKVGQREVISGTMTPGYKIVDKHMVIDETTADAVRLAFETFNATGSYAAAIRAVYGRGLPTTGNGMKLMLSREIYIGRRYGLDDFAPPLIDEVLFRSVQKQIKMRRRTRSDRIYLFSGLLRCADCGAVMAAGYRPKHATGGDYIYYRCPNHYQKAVKVCANQKQVYENTLERELIAKLPQMVLEHIEMEEEKRKPVVDAQKQRDAIQRKIERLKDLYINELISLEEYRTDKDKLLAELDSIPELHDAPVSASDALKPLLGMNLAEVYGQLDKAEKRLFWRSVIKEIRFDSKRQFFYDFE